MQLFTRPATPAPSVVMRVDPHLFLWQGGGIVLIGMLTDDNWSLCRGWLSADTLTDVRRWRFPSSLGFQVQVRRLCRDATGRADLADLAFDGAGRWVGAQRHS